MFLQLTLVTVYILFSHIKRRFYVGQTDDVELRLKRHNGGLVRSTKSGIPWKRLWLREVATRSEALKLERKIKKRGIRRFLEDLGINWQTELGV